MQAQTHDDKTFFGEVIEEINKGFSSVPKYSLPFFSSEFCLTLTPRIPEVVLKMFENLRGLREKISMGTQAISQAILSNTPHFTVLTYSMTRTSQYSH